MRAVRLHAPGEALRLEVMPDPVPQGAEVVVRVAGCGVCHTDLHIVDGTQRRVELPLTLGHEVSGWIEAAADAATGLLRRARLGVGDPVLVFGGWGCGACAECRAGDEQRCARGRSPGFQADGGYAERLLVPHPRHLEGLGSLDPVTAAPLADAGLTSYRAVRRASGSLEPESRVLVVGCGGLGQFLLQHLRLLPGGAALMIVVVERDTRHAQRATQLGADLAILDEGASTVREALGGDASAVFDLVGSEATLALAAEVVTPGGVVMLEGEAGGTVRFGFDTLPVEAWLTTTAWGSREDLRAVVDLARRDRLRWEVEQVPLDNAQAAHDRLRAGDVAGRLVLVP